MTEYVPKKRWLKFVDVSLSDRKTKIFQVVNKETEDFLGIIKWSPTWRQYIFDTDSIILAEGCLFEIFEFIKMLREERELNNEQA